MWQECHIDEKRSEKMTFKRALSVSALAAGIGFAGLFGVGLGTASADPWGCDRPGTPPCGDHRDDHRDDRGGPAPVDWHGRGVDQGRFDHQPFNWMGQQVNPVPSGDGNGWGFWFLGQWIPL
jgi:hypothetical protein